MIFEQDKVCFEILDIFLLSRKNKTIKTSNKPCHILGYRLEGSSEFTFKNKTFNVDTNELIYIPLNSVYSQKTEYEKVVAIQLCISNYNEQKPSVFSCKDIPEVRELFIKLCETWAKPEEGYYYKCMAYLYEIFALIRKNNAESAARDSRIEETLAYIRENVFSCDFSLDTAIKKSNYSEVYIRRLFKKYYNTTPCKYINELRITRSLSLLKSGQFSIEETAYRCGYNNPNYFGTVFKKLIGCPPHVYALRYTMDLDNVQ